ncbi:helix-turn-helix domain-containing protein [Myroides sp. LJL119]
MKSENFSRDDFARAAEELYKLVSRIRRDLVHGLSNHLSVDGIKLYDSKKVADLLCVSLRTLQRYRSDGKIKYHIFGGKAYYKDVDVRKFLREVLDRPFKGDITIEK